jgi:carboxyl-terminal processing protease
MSVLCTKTRRLAAAGCLVLLVGCAHDISERDASGFSALETERLLAFGFDAIAERYVDPVPLRRLAFDGLRGLSTIDPAIGVEEKDGHLELAFSGKKIADFFFPEDQSPTELAQLSVKVVEKGREISTSLQAAKMEKLQEALFDAALTHLDIYSHYSGAEEARRHRAARSGFGDVGLTLTATHRGLEIISVDPEGPGEAARIAPHDILINIDGQSIEKLPPNEIERRLRGAVGSPITLTLSRQNSGIIFEAALRRRLFIPPTVDMSIKGGVVFLRVFGFNQRTAAALAERIRAAKDLREGHIKGYVLDLRGNRGGLLDQAVAVGDLFLPRMRIVTTHGRHAQASQHYDSSGYDILEGAPLVALIDGKTASAAEIVAAALQDAGRAVLVGTASYGKGTVQTVIRMPNDGEITLTWSRFFTPSGYALQGLGVLPNLCTSGATSPSEATGLIDHLRRGSLSVAGDLAVWRSLNNSEGEPKQRMRRLCPPENGDGRFDDDVARRLLSESALHARALSLSNSLAEVKP